MHKIYYMDYILKPIPPLSHGIIKKSAYIHETYVSYCTVPRKYLYPSNEHKWTMWLTLCCCLTVGKSGRTHGSQKEIFKVHPEDVCVFRCVVCC